MISPSDPSKIGKGAYSPAVRAGPFIFLSGQLPCDPDTGQVIGSDIASQTVQVISNVRRLLEIEGASLDDVVSVTAYLSNISDWENFNETYKGLMPLPFATRTTMGVQLHKGLVELTVIAYIDRDKRK